jgi:hypothetical protein
MVVMVMVMVMVRMVLLMVMMVVMVVMMLMVVILIFLQNDYRGGLGIFMVAGKLDLVVGCWFLNGNTPTILLTALSCTYHQRFPSPWKILLVFIER